MAKEKTEKTVSAKEATNCIACAKDNRVRPATSRSLCGSHLQSASKLIKANEEAKENGKKPVHVDSKGREITWSLLESKGLATAPQRRNDVAAIFLS